MPANSPDSREPNRVITAQNDWEGSTAEHMGNALGDLIKTLLIIGWNCKYISHVAELN